MGTSLNYISLVLNALTIVCGIVLLYAGRTVPGVVFLLLGVGIGASAYRNLKRAKK